MRCIFIQKLWNETFETSFGFDFGLCALFCTWFGFSTYSENGKKWTKKKKVICNRKNVL